MKIVKESRGGSGGAPSREELELIGRLAEKRLEPEEVYTFKVRLCDNEIDRDGERFAPETLEALAPLFVGKSGIFDHQWSARGQAARIYKTGVVREPDRVTRAGDGYCWLKGWAYMVRTEGNRDLIAEIEGGIKREVSVGCAVERAVCSICGANRNQEDCGHVKGRQYGGKLCYTSLEGASDAYEFSFVAVPAQPRAGVIKSAGGGVRLKELAEKNPRCRGELERLEDEAQLGRAYRKRMREEVVRLALLADGALEPEAIRAMADKLSPGELETLAGAYRRQARKNYPIRTQLEYGQRREDPEKGDQAFLV